MNPAPNMNKVLLSLSVGLVGLVGLAIIWYYGGLADFYAQYPDRKPLRTSAPNYAPLVIAHRGYSQAAPENTLAAIRAAIANNIDYVEIDIRVTADGVPIVIHDADVDRTTDGEARTGSWAGAAFTISRSCRSLRPGDWRRVASSRRHGW